MNPRPRIDSVTLTYTRQGPCERAACTNTRPVERSKAFTAKTEREAEWFASRWMGKPLMHKRCEEYR